MVDGFFGSDGVINLGLGMTMVNSEGVTADFAYSVDLASDNVSHNLLLNVRFDF